MLWRKIATIEFSKKKIRLKSGETKKEKLPNNKLNN